MTLIFIWQLIPGTDGALALSMAQVIIEEDLYDKEFVEQYVYGLMNISLCTGFNAGEGGEDYRSPKT